MKLWLIKAPSHYEGEIGVRYDEADRMVVRAPTEWDARAVACHHPSAGSARYWLALAEVTEIAAEGDPAVILAHINYA
jgi:hypothetical protein